MMGAMAMDTPLPGFDRHWMHARHTTPSVDYEFAGTIGGENVMACGTCGSLVRAQDEGDHAAYHLDP